MRPLPAYPSPEICCLRPRCPRCSLSCHSVTRPVSFSMEFFFKRLPADVQSHLVHDRTSDPLSLALCADEIHQSRVSSISVVNHVHSAPEDCPVLAVQAPPASRACSHHHPSATPSASHRSDSPDLFWYQKNHADRSQKCRAPWFLVMKLATRQEDTC